MERHDVDNITNKGGERVGNEFSTKIWQNKWLLTLTSYKVQSPLKNLPKTSLVKDFLNNEGKEWNKSLILDIF